MLLVLSFMMLLPSTAWGEDYPLTVGGIQVTDGNKDDILGDESGSVSFDPENSILTLANVTIDLKETEKNVVESGLAKLTVKLKGECTFEFDLDKHAFKGTGSDNEITFVPDLEIPGTLSMSGSPFNGLKVNYDSGLGLLGSSILTLSAPEFTSTTATGGGITVTLSLPLPSDDYNGSTIYYAVTYADETIANTTYTAPFTMTKPGTVTAYLEPELGGKSNTVVGKYFGFLDAPYTIIGGQEIEPTLYPSFDWETDYIQLIEEDPYTSSDENVATFTNGTIKGVGEGTATLAVTLQSGGDGTIVLNPSNGESIQYPISLTVNVGQDLSERFVSSNSFASYYSDTDDSHTIPDGMEAYIVTGTDEANHTVTVTQLNILPSKTPVLLYKGTGTSFISVKTTTALSSGIDLTQNKLRYAAADVTASGKEFILFSDEYVQATGTIPATKIYLTLGDAPSSARAFSIDVSGDDTTGIRTVPELVEGPSEQWYDLQGRRIQKPTKAGLYIVNGKKMVVK